jgi:peptidoglycan/xylan/chitin deacetylase (PgdA/CDA1 family)
MSLSILMYHSVADNPSDPHALHPDRFEAQMAKLVAQNRSLVDLPQAVGHLSKWTFRSDLALTFDDGYQDFLLNAAPVLKRYQLPATVFVPTGLLGETAVWDSYDKTKALLDWDELAEVQRLGFGVASHTISHPRLTECDETRLEYELRGSLDQLKERLPEVVPLLSYPGGFFGLREMRAARAAGYSGAVGVASRFKNHAWTNPYRLRRWRWEGESRSQRSEGREQKSGKSGS